jgi:hypothetical protein
MLLIVPLNLLSDRADLGKVSGDKILIDHHDRCGVCGISIGEQTASD